MATVGELSWVWLVTGSLRIVNSHLQNRRSITFMSHLSFFLIFCAEIYSTIGTITKNSLFFTLEEGSWVVTGVFLLTPSIFMLYRDNQKVNGRKYENYLRIFAVTLFIYDIWGCTCDVPDNINRYLSERDTVPSPWLSFSDGFSQAFDACKVDRTWETWSGYVLWMTGYFSLGVWSCVALSRLEHNCRDETTKGGGKGEPLLNNAVV
ncbi:hypothetical protein TL16_g00639 [Triparma laevis f. inornata]|uniref:Uncharacterized protein n=1 Tax=Triparma laevis f. inornata TaxID=1714386 RepID=A0A9W6ZCV2_9STRA|nr:hypothetical protein TL16_g00639 [Triparma laevis f. inornata]